MARTNTVHWEDRQCGGVSGAGPHSSQPQWFGREAEGTEEGRKTNEQPDGQKSWSSFRSPRVLKHSCPEV